MLPVLKEELTVAAEAIPGFDPAVPNEIHVNSAGNFEIGGPQGDNRLSGKKLVADAYGPRVPIGGGALSGKDFYKADRAGAILARRWAKLMVLTGAARECTGTIAYMPGDVRGRIVSLLDQDRHELQCEIGTGLMNFLLEAVGDRFAGTEDLIDVTRHGHFTHSELLWEHIPLN